MHQGHEKHRKNAAHSGEALAKPGQISRLHHSSPKIQVNAPESSPVSHIHILASISLNSSLLLLSIGNHHSSAKMVKDKIKSGGPRAAKKTIGEVGGSSAHHPPAPVNWTKSTATELTLETFQNQGELPSKLEISWHVAGEETQPSPCEGEVVVLLDHVTRGLHPPGSLFFRRVLQYYGLTPLDIAPNSVLNLSTFAVFCEDYLQIEPSLELFLEIFYCNPLHKNKPLGPYGGVSIQRRKECDFRL